MVCGAPSAPRALAAVLAAAPRGAGAAAASFPVAVSGVVFRHRLLHGTATSAGTRAPLRRHDAAPCVPRRRGRPWRRAHHIPAHPACASQTTAPRQYATAAAMEATPKADDGAEEGHGVAVKPRAGGEGGSFVFKEVQTKKTKRLKELAEKLGSAAEPRPGDPYPFAYPQVAEDDTLYHLAMQLLEKNKADRENAAERIAKERDAAIAEGTKDSEEKARLLQLQVENELVQAEINFPEVHWNFFHGRYDLRKPVYRHLFRKTLSEEVEFMIDTMRQTRVINDLLPKAAFDRINARLELSFSGEIPQYLQEIHADEPQKDIKLYKMSAPRNPNVRAVPLYRALVSPRFLIAQPTVRVTPLAPEEKLYTLLLVDADDPYPEKNTFRERCHWLVTDMPIGMFTCEYGPLPSDAGNTVLPYIPPHPQRGTKPHRYTLLLMEQSGEIGADILKYDGAEVDSTTRTIELIPLIKRNKLIIRGATGFRSQWDESVYGIYRTILGEDFEPVYGVIREASTTGSNGLPLSMFTNA